jgi:hypothetical protein
MPISIFSHYFFSLFSIVAATSWIEKRQMKEQKRMQEEVNKAEQASKILEEEKRLRLKQQTAGLKVCDFFLK